MIKSRIFLYIWSSLTTAGVYGACTLPSTWDGEWHDSSLSSGDITINRTAEQVNGWSTTAYSSVVSSWTCFAEDTSNNLLLFKGDTTVNLFSAPANVYRCMKWTKITDYSYSYQIYANIEPQANNKRIYVIPVSADTTTVSSGCSPTTGYPSVEETIVMVKKGYILNATQYCPTPFLGTFQYQHNTSSTVTCGSGSVWDICADRTYMTVNLTQCSTAQFYSAGGVGYCSFSTSNGSNYYVTVINYDTTVDDSTTYRFTCYAVTTDGSTVYASDSKGVCALGQDPRTKSSDGTGVITFTPYVTCPFTTSPAEEVSSANIGIIAGIVVVVIIIIAAVVAGFLLYKKYKAKINPREHSDEEKVQPPEPIVAPIIVSRPATSHAMYTKIQVNPADLDNEEVQPPGHVTVSEITESKPRDALIVTPPSGKKPTLQPLNNNTNPTLTDSGSKPIPPIRS